MAFLTEAANRGSISTGYDIGNSCKFESANTESLTKSQTASNRRTWTLSFWFKRTKVDSALQYVFEAGSSGSTLLSLFINGTSDWRIYEYVSGARKLGFYSTTQLNDPAAWYHMVIACDTTQSSAADRFKIYLNGEDLTATSGYFSTAAYPDQNYETNINNSSATLSIGKAPTASTNFCGYISEFNFIDGLMKQSSDFGRFDSASGIWVPKEYTGSYGNEGYFLNFADASDLGDDESGNGKDFTENNITAVDQSTDTPTNNFAIGNPLNVTPAGTFTEGATRWVSVNGTGMNGAWNLATIALTGGKWHCEVKCISTSSYYQWGISPTHINDSFSSRCMYRSDGNIYNAGSGGNTTGHTSYTAGDIIGMSYDASANTVIFSKNGTAVVTKTAIAHNEPYFFGGTGLSSGTYTGDFNFGGYTSYTISSPESDENGYGTFEYAPPSGYYALCTKNLAEYG